jgi:5-methylthioadenosine/S-adenosylhomocysteine deaminase
VDDSIKIIENGLVFTGDKKNHAGRFAILVRNDRIADIGKPAQVLKSLYPNAEVIDATGKILLPGFVDAHHTGDSFILRYLTTGSPMSQWNKNPAISNIFNYLQKEATYEEFLSLYRLSYYAAIKSGITTLAEYGVDTPEQSFAAAVEVMRQANLKGFVGLHNSDQIEAARRLHDTKLHFAYVIENEEKLTTYDLKSAIRLASELEWPILLHLGQTQQANDIIKKNFHKSIVQLFADYRIFSAPLQLIHLVCFEKEDFNIIAESGTSLVLSPSAILQKETDMPPFEELLKHRIPLALGTDWGPVQAIENLRIYCSILKSLGLPIEKTYELLALHTINSARALGLDAEIGSIETGKKADIVFLDLSEFRMNTILADDSLDRILDNVLQESNSQQVSDVMMNGEFCVRANHLLTYSEDDLADQAQILFRKLVHIGERKFQAAPHSAAVLPFTTQLKKKQILLTSDTESENGSKIVRKEPANQDEKSDSPSGLTSKLPKNVRKIFGDDEV